MKKTITNTTSLPISLLTDEARALKAKGIGSRASYAAVAKRYGFTNANGGGNWPGLKKAIEQGKFSLADYVARGGNVTMEQWLTFCPLDINGEIWSSFRGLATQGGKFPFLFGVVNGPAYINFDVHGELNFDDQGNNVCPGIDVKSELNNISRILREEAYGEGTFFKLDIEKVAVSLCPDEAGHVIEIVNSRDSLKVERDMLMATTRLGEAFSQGCADRTAADYAEAQAVAHGMGIDVEDLDAVSADHGETAENWYANGGLR